MLADLAEQEEQQHGVEVSLFDGDGGKWRWRGWFGVKVKREAAESGEEVASNEESFVLEGEGVEVVEGEGEKGGGGKERKEAVVVAVDI